MFDWVKGCRQASPWLCVGVGVCWCRGVLVLVLVSYICRTVWNRGLFLAHPTYWHKSSASDNAQISSFWEVWWASVQYGSHRTCLLLIPRAQRYVVTFRFGFLRALFSYAVEASTFGSLTLYRDTKFIIGFDFAVILSSPTSCCVLFDIASRLLVELKWLMFNKHKRWFH